jgi:hypothetical protein
MELTQTVMDNLCPVRKPAQGYHRELRLDAEMKLTVLARLILGHVRTTEVLPNGCESSSRGIGFCFSLNLQGQSKTSPGGISLNQVQLQKQLADLRDEVLSRGFSDFPTPG